MLRSLEIRDILIIEKLDLAFQPGLNVLTGETGAGKSILLDSLGFVLGWRGRAELVRTGATQGEVTAVFDLSDDHPARNVLEEAGLPAEDALILRRLNTTDGRKTAWVNDRRVSGEILRQLSETLVELHGQHDDGGLMNAQGHAALLDEFGDHLPKLHKTRQAWQARLAALHALENAQARLDAATAEEDFLRHAVEELDQLAPEPGEDAELDQRRRAMQGADRIRADIQRAASALGAEGADSQMRDALRWLETSVEQTGDLFENASKALERAMAELSDAQQEVEAGLNTLRFDPHELETVEERLFAIRALARKHNVQPDELPDLAVKLNAKLSEIDNGVEEIETLRAELATAEETYSSAATALRKAREAAAKKLDKAMAGELAPLKMERAVFETTMGDAKPGLNGMDEVQFRVATNPGAPSGPLNKIASGGELSRFLLALKVCLMGHRTGVTMIFDEIDRGVGGATADAVGRRLSTIADKAQVLVVTHSPQVAARGGDHWQVSKAVVKGETRTRVDHLTPDARIDEIARMLSGDTVTDEARAAAVALLEQ